MRHDDAAHLRARPINLLQHPPKLRPIVVRRRDAALHELADQLQAVVLRILPNRRHLRRQRQVLLRLLRRAHARIPHRLRRAHRPPPTLFGRFIIRLLEILQRLRRDRQQELTLPSKDPNRLTQITDQWRQPCNATRFAPRRSRRRRRRRGRPEAVLSTLRSLVRSNAANAELKNGLARAEYNLGVIFHFVEADYERASAQYDAAIELAGSNSKVAAAALNNRGVLRNSMAGEEAAFAEWSDVIAMAEVSDEARACALNNRADVFAHRGAHEDAIRDRSTVLALRETSYNRRYIALSRRSRSLAVLGRTEEALADLEMVLATEDIAPEQKANARFERGSLFAGLGRHVEARQDLDAVLASENVFTGTHARALVELAELSRREGDAERAHEYLDAALEDHDADPRTHVEAFVVAARLLTDAGDQEGAETIWLKVLASPNASARQKSIAERRGQTAGALGSSTTRPPGAQD